MLRIISEKLSAAQIGQFRRWTVGRFCAALREKVTPWATLGRLDGCSAGRMAVRVKAVKDDSVFRLE